MEKPSLEKVIGMLKKAEPGGWEVGYNKYILETSDFKFEISKWQGPYAGFGVDYNIKVDDLANGNTFEYGGWKNKKIIKPAYDEIKSKVDKHSIQRLKNIL